MNEKHKKYWKSTASNSEREYQFDKLDHILWNRVTNQIEKS